MRTRRGPLAVPPHRVARPDLEPGRDDAEVTAWLKSRPRAVMRCIPSGQELAVDASADAHDIVHAEGEQMLPCS